MSKNVENDISKNLFFLKSIVPKDRDCPLTNPIFFEDSSHNKLVQNKRTKMNSIGICGVARLKKILGLFYFLSISCLTSNADLLDDAMANVLNTY